MGGQESCDVKSLGRYTKMHETRVQRNSNGIKEVLIDSKDVPRISKSLMSLLMFVSLYKGSLRSSIY